MIGAIAEYITFNNDTQMALLHQYPRSLYKLASQFDSRCWCKLEQQVDTQDFRGLHVTQADVRAQWQSHSDGNIDHYLIAAARASRPTRYMSLRLLSVPYTYCIYFANC